MSRLNEILYVPDRAEFTFGCGDEVYKIENSVFYRKIGSQFTEIENIELITLIIEHPEYIILQDMPLSYDLEMAVRGRIAEGTPWATKDDGEYYVYFHSKKPYLDNDYWESDGDMVKTISNLFDFVTYSNSPIYLPDLLRDGVIENE